MTAVAPGPMDTPFFYGQESAEAVAYHKSASALGGLTKIEDIEPLVRFLVTDGWWITGQTIFANGGYTTAKITKAVSHRAAFLYNALIIRTLRVPSLRKYAPALYKPNDRYPLPITLSNAMK